MKILCIVTEEGSRSPHAIVSSISEAKECARKYMISAEGICPFEWEVWTMTTTGMAIEFTFAA